MKTWDFPRKRIWYCTEHKSTKQMAFPSDWNFLLLSEYGGFRTIFFSSQFLFRTQMILIVVFMWCLCCVCVFNLFRLTWQFKKRRNILMCLAGFVTFSIIQASGNICLVLSSSRTDYMPIPTRSCPCRTEARLKIF